MTECAKKNTYLAMLFVGFALLLYLPGSAAAQTESDAEADILGIISWQADSYAPADYHGKVLPGRTSTINLVFELLVDGRPATDLDQTSIRWLVNNRPLQGGLGMRVATLEARDYSAGLVTVRVLIEDYAGKRVETTVRIPIMEPRVVVNAPYASNNVFGESVHVSARPFFFSVRSLAGLLFEWEVNNEAVLSGNGVHKLAFDPVDALVGQKATISVRVRDRANVLASSRDTIKLILR
ncbi:MAG: hypothetical protein COU11_03340 [Candidatus Harrisonbacteria bacterium CG10_big_fil_rev_8_21_14_0_10_49_15]|uniref:Uncharacterized protein n=1 Tax=Candidatus Harrisonbacteria bacterium CG10_big_fil_rev_8_21_14_0_10_49_15 TaxID=1974587 RepID=A0A2H0UKD1_9BACT|nr:MAG: hypothetical protein COU11_03340 [Candidatus Harrisonbacteria bacterium CG10_big_fil_rev_8_21_14_0_10_49_15]